MGGLQIRCSGGEIIVVEESVAVQSKMLKGLMEAEYLKKEKGVVDINIDAKVLTKVIDYCEHEVEDADFVKIDKEMLIALVKASHYLVIESLYDLTCQAVADLLKGLTPEEIREAFCIKSNFSIEEEKVLRDLNAWAFSGV